jgi:predicted PurR-regulated permease PerM
MTTMNRRKPRTAPRPSTVQNEDLRWDSFFSSLGRIEIVMLVGGVLLLLMLLYTIQDILSPFLVVGALLFLLYPLRQYTLARTLMWLGALLFGLWFLDQIAPILAPFIISLVFAYILSPVVDLFEGWKVPRWVASLILLVLFVAGIALAMFFVLPVAVTQLEGVLDGISNIISQWRATLWSSNVIKVLERYGIPAEELRQVFSSQLTPRFEDILKTLFRASSSLVSSLSDVITQLFYVILVPFLTFYMLTDFPKISLRFKMLFPRSVRETVARQMEQADELIGHYLRGALTVAILQGFLVAVLFSLAGIKYALLLGLLAGVLDLVPYFGLIITMIVSVIVAFFSDPPVMGKVVFALLSVGALHLAEVTFLSPRIVGDKVGLHPLLIILSLLVFMHFLGFVGLLVAIPATALIVQLVREWERSRRHPQAGDASVDAGA